MSKTPTGKAISDQQPPRTFYTPREVATSLNVSYKRVLEMCATGQLRHIRTGQHIRIPVAALAELADTAA